MKRYLALLTVMLVALACFANAAGPPGAPYSLPSQTGNSGKYLTTNGIVESWSAIIAGATAPIKIYPSADSTTGVQVTQANGSTVVMDFDTTNNRVGIRTDTPGAFLEVKGTTYSSYVGYGSNEDTYIRPGKTTGSVFLDVGANIGLFATVFGTSANRVIGIASGDAAAPTTSPANTVQLWASDFGAVAGKTTLYMRDEAGNSAPIALVKKYTKTTTTTPVTLTLAEVCNSIIFVGTGSGTINLPAGDATIDGCQTTFRTTAAVTLYIDPNGSQVIDLSGTSLTGGNKIASSGFSGDQCTLTWDQTGSAWRTTGCTLFVDGGA